MLSWSELVSRAGVDPSAELQNFTDGNPADIATLAGDLAAASGHQRLAAELDHQASAQLAASYHVNGQPVHDFHAHVQRVKRDLGNSGDNLEQISRRLGAISAELGDRTAAANGTYATVVSGLVDVDQRFTALGERMAAMTPLEMAANSADLESARRRLVAEAVDIVRSGGNTIRRSGQDYSDFLDGSLAMLGRMGYLPPDELGEGPGDVDLTPDAGARAGAAARAALDAPPGAESLAALNRSRAGLDAIVASLGKDGVPTKAQADYLTAYLDGIGADGLGKYADRVGAAVAGSTPDTGDRVAGTSVQSLANGIQALSRFDHGAHMPAAVTSILHDSLGAQTPTGRFANAAGEVSQGVTNLPRYERLAHLLQTATTPAGTEFSTDLGASAIARKQDLNQITATQDSAALTPSAFPTDAQRAAQASGPVDGRFSDTGMSSMLRMAARDTPASQSLLGNAALRPALLGAGWSDGGGAAAVVSTATERNQPDAVHAETAARLAKTVIGEVGADPSGWRGLTPKGGQISNALTDVAAQYIDAFGTPRDGHDGAPAGIDPAHRQADGSYSAGFQLKDSDRSGFLRFVASDGPPPPHVAPGGMERRHESGPTAAEWESRPDLDVQKLHVAADLDTVGSLSEALRHGGSTDQEWKFPLRSTGDVNGAIARAEYDTLVGAGVHDDDAAKAAQLDRKSSETITERILGEGLKVGIAAIPAGGEAFKVASGFVKDTFNASFDAALAHLDPVPASTGPKLAAQLWDDTVAQQEGHRTYLLGQALADAGKLPEPVDPDRPALPPMTGPDGHLRPYATLVAEGQLPRLRIAAEGGPGSEDFTKWGDLVGQADRTFRDYLPGGGYRAVGSPDPLSQDQLMELRYGSGWRSIPEPPR